MIATKAAPASGSVIGKTGESLGAGLSEKMPRRSKRPTSSWPIRVNTTAIAAIKRVSAHPDQLGRRRVPGQFSHQNAIIAIGASAKTANGPRRIVEPCAPSAAKARITATGITRRSPVSPSAG
jgi:hypothetical protein